MEDLISGLRDAVDYNIPGDQAVLVSYCNAIRIREMFPPSWSPTKHERDVMNAACLDLYPVDSLEGVFYRFGGIHGLNGLAAAFKRSKVVKTALDTIRGTAGEEWLIWSVSDVHRRTENGWTSMLMHHNAVPSPLPRLGSQDTVETNPHPDPKYVYPNRENLPRPAVFGSRQIPSPAGQLMTPPPSLSDQQNKRRKLDADALHQGYFKSFQESSIQEIQQSAVLLQRRYPSPFRPSESPYEQRQPPPPRPPSLRQMPRHEVPLTSPFLDNPYGHRMRADPSAVTVQDHNQAGPSQSGFTPGPLPILGTVENTTAVLSTTQPCHLTNSAERQSTSTTDASRDESAMRPLSSFSVLPESPSSLSPDDPNNALVAKGPSAVVAATAINSSYAFQFPEGDGRRQMRIDASSLVRPPKSWSSTVLETDQKLMPQDHTSSQLRPSSCTSPSRIVASFNKLDQRYKDLAMPITFLSDTSIPKRMLLHAIEPSHTFNRKGEIDLIPAPDIGLAFESGQLESALQHLHSQDLIRYDSNIESFEVTAVIRKHIHNTIKRDTAQELKYKASKLVFHTFPTSPADGPTQ